MNKESQPTYESALKELQEIVVQLQEEVISMDDLTEKIKRATQLIGFCREKLRETSITVESILEEKNG